MDKKTSIKIKLLTILIVILFLIPSAMEFTRGLNTGIILMDIKSDYAPVMMLHPKSTLDAITSGENHNIIVVEQIAVVSVEDSSMVPGWVKTLSLMSAFISAAVMVWIVILICRIVPAISHGKLTAIKTINRLKLLACLLGGSMLLAYIANSIEVIHMRGAVSLSNFDIAFSDIPGGIVVALIIFILAEVLRIHYNLEQDQELTI